MVNQNEIINYNIESSFKMNAEDISHKTKTILDKMEKQFNETHDKLNYTADDLNRKRIEVQEKYEVKFNRIKEVITKYFERYDVDLEELKINMKVLNQKYTDWSKILIEPTSLNEARLYALETRMHEEEEIRIKEYEYVRDLMKKLIFSLEQTNLQSLEQGVKEQSPAKPIGLPNLLQTQTMSGASK